MLIILSSVILVLLFVVAIVLAITYRRVVAQDAVIERQLAAQIKILETEMRSALTENRQEISRYIVQMQDSLLQRVHESISWQRQQLDEFDKKLLALNTDMMQAQQGFLEAVNAKQQALQTSIGEHFSNFLLQQKKEGEEQRQDLRQRFNDFSKMQHQQTQASLQQLQDLRAALTDALKTMQTDNSKQLEQIRHTVDEKLQTTLEKRLGESFKMVSERLELVHKGLGEMQTLATGVGDLKKVLSNVKTRGILGEYQLEKILEQILTSQQYARDVQPIPGQRQQVEFAVKLPGHDAQSQIWLPIDSKFPIENYQLLLEAYEQADKSMLEQAQKELLRGVESFAKDISSKYIAPPHTTDFAIMFLPVEGLYAEVMRHVGLFEKLQRHYKITITGPSTLAALLNSLNMGFRTLAVRQRSSEVWEVLRGVKTEFSKFAEHLAKVQKQLNTASSSLEMLSSTRTNAITRKLRGVEVLEDKQSAELLELES